MADLTTTTETKTPTQAVAALGLALLAIGFSLYGALLAEDHLAGSPLNAARNTAGAEFTHASEGARTALAVVAYALPFVLGVVAAVLGGRAVRTLDNHPARRIGHLYAVFAVMVGSLAAVVSACMAFGVFGWPHVPHYYTA
ncbi:hypothetical protein [Urbifossiella limnaea]|uniref:Uncharacterized protein n=1 Tax=Urbifossiella limnaea TaxID=2528023 RepID=A0A517XU73_9BACT|nr:hypothetical protein [Urbifossiella limnaea]QDU21047.1 hypothetical protein ETAA1_30110 [Urbifossiella limnaea]